MARVWYFVFLRFLFIFIYLFNVSECFACMCTTYMPDFLWSPGTGVTASCEPLWELGIKPRFFRRACSSYSLRPRQRHTLYQLYKVNKGLLRYFLTSFICRFTPGLCLILFILFVYYYGVCVHTYVWVWACAMVNIWRSVDRFQVLILPFRFSWPLKEKFHPRRTKTSPCLNAGGGLLAYFT